MVLNHPLPSAYPVVLQTPLLYELIVLISLLWVSWFLDKFDSTYAMEVIAGIQ